MTEKARQLKEKLDIVSINRDDLNTICKDRLDFGFDSIYFRYAELCDELAAYKASCKGTNPVKERDQMNWRKMHFYNALEQLMLVHNEENENGTN